MTRWRCGRYSIAVSVVRLMMLSSTLVLLGPLAQAEDLAEDLMQLTQESTTLGGNGVTEQGWWVFSHPEGSDYVSIRRTEVEIRDDRAGRSDDLLRTVYDVRVRVGNASAFTGAIPVRTWDSTAFTLQMQGELASPGPSSFSSMTSAALGGVVLVASVALLALQHTRLAKENILQGKVRLLTYETVREHPGATFTEVRDAIGLKNGVAAYHLGVLEKQGLIHSEKSRGHRWYYPSGDVSLWRDLPLSPTQRSLLEKVRNAPGIGIRELARSLNRRHGSVAYNVKGLAREGLLRTRRAGRKVQCFAVEAEEKAIPFVTSEEENDLHGIEKALGKTIPRVTLPDFDHKAPPPPKIRGRERGRHPRESPGGGGRPRWRRGPPHR